MGVKTICEKKAKYNIWKTAKQSKRLFCNYMFAVYDLNASFDVGKVVGGS